ncbi:MAG: diaminohydroxyphosphoribosylaminopyrimidine deaminase [Candidatus Tokpelaia sp. JSC161]|nr:MAG: diaminohydroxyphosphoribosylaminopyrimidine deaminase [Candidatus Tokpelaia sp. JSC161]
MPGSDDKRFMEAAIRLGYGHSGQTGDNPSVGALIVQHTKQGSYIVGRGRTGKGGRPHAEVLALAESGVLAESATVYVTLEPCSHYGKTPPCADALIKAGVARVFIAIRDSDPRVNGQGIHRLRKAGIEVVENFLKSIAEKNLGPYIRHKRVLRPYVTLKLAVSGNGFIGNLDIGKTQITGMVSRAQVHLLRAESNAILIGIGTVLVDNPMLDCRLSGLGDRSPIRVILDSHLRVSLNSHLVKSARTVPLWIVCGDSLLENSEKIAALSAAGCRIFFCKSEEGRINLEDLLSRLESEGIRSLLVEGGARVASSFWMNGFVDRLILFKSPMTLHGHCCKAPDFTDQMNKYRKISCYSFEEDSYLEYTRVM